MHETYHAEHDRDTMTVTWKSIVGILLTLAITFGGGYLGLAYTTLGNRVLALEAGDTKTKEEHKKYGEDIAVIKEQLKGIDSKLEDQKKGQDETNKKLDRLLERGR